MQCNAIFTMLQLLSEVIEKVPKTYSPPFSKCIKVGMMNQCKQLKSHYLKSAALHWEEGQWTGQILSIDCLLFDHSQIFYEDKSALV